MKNTAIFIVIMGLNIVAFSQTNIISSYNSVDVGRNISLSVQKKMNNHSLIFGLKYGLNSLRSDDQNELLRKRFYAVNFIEHIGLNLSYQYHFNLKTSVLEPFIFYDFQLTRSHTRNRTFFPVDYNESTKKFLYEEDIAFLGPFVALENNIGIGFSAKLTKKYFYIKK